MNHYNDHSFSWTLFATYLYRPVIIILTGWTIVFLVVLYIFCRSDKDDETPFLKTDEGVRRTNSLPYDRLPILYDHCADVDARHVYLLQLSYGDRKCNIVIPETTITITFLRKDRTKEATMLLGPKLLTENHQRYLRLLAQRRRWRKERSSTFSLAERPLLQGKVYSF